jgi:hypothetical protein
MTTAFVLGNGVSRQVVSLSALKPLGKIYGCNALYRDFVPDVLVATDRPIATAIQESGYAKQHRFYTRRPIEGYGAETVPHEYFGYSSGPIAVSLAAKDGHKRIYLLGFDLGPTHDQKFNNLYAGTEFYKAVDATPTYTGNWIKQLRTVIRDHPLSKFYRVHGETATPVTELQALPNAFSLEMNSFFDRINTENSL